MLSGRRLNLIDPSPVDIEISDIAHGLAFVARWNGQTIGDHPYSVAEHSMLVERIVALMDPGASVEVRFAALMHDAAEYVIGDLISPVKDVLGDEYRQMETRLSAAIRLRFGLPMELSKGHERLIKRADRMSAWLESRRIAGFTDAEANKLFLRPPPKLSGQLSVVLRPPGQVRSEFANTANRLADAL